MSTRYAEEVRAAIGPAHSPRRHIPTLIPLQDLTAGGLDDVDAPEPPTRLVCPSCLCTQPREPDGHNCTDCMTLMVPDSRVSAHVPPECDALQESAWRVNVNHSNTADFTLSPADRNHEATTHAYALARLCTPYDALMKLSHALAAQRQEALRMHDNDSADALDYAVRGIETAARELVHV